MSHDNQGATKPTNRIKKTRYRKKGSSLFVSKQKTKDNPMSCLKIASLSMTKLNFMVRFYDCEPFFLFLFTIFRSFFFYFVVHLCVFQHFYIMVCIYKKINMLDYLPTKTNVSKLFSLQVDCY